MEEPTPQTKGISSPTAIIIAGLIVAVAIVWTNTKSAPAPSTTQQTAPTTVAVDSSKVNTTGEPFIGNPNAPVTIAYWFDYQCPFCKQDEQTSLLQILSDYVNNGKAKLVFKDYAFLGDDSQTLGKYARAVWAVAPDKFYQWHKAIFDNQGTENTGWATKAKIFSISANVLGIATTNKVVAAVAANGVAYQQAMDADKLEGSGFGITGTPALIVGKQLVSGAVPYAQFKTAIDAALAGK